VGNGANFLSRSWRDLIVSESVYDELLELLIDCTTDNNRFYAVEGMKLAIGIMDGTYVPKV
jgi:hypothetical protein